MAEEMEQSQYTDAAIVEDTDMLLVRRGSAGLEIPGGTIVKKDASGRVGVGTSAPAYPLHVAGDAVFGFADAPSIYNVGFFARSPSGGTMDWDVRTNDATWGAKTLLTLSSFGTILPGVDNERAFGSASKRWEVIFAATGTISTSDEREKAHISSINDAILDAWGKVEWVQFKWNASIQDREDGARWHFGLIAQHVRDIMVSHFTPIKGDQAEAFVLSLGFLCHDEWSKVVEPIMETREVERIRRVLQEERTSIIDGEEKVIADWVDEPYTVFEQYDTGEVREIAPAGDRWGLRYDLCFAMEAAWQRRERSRERAAREALEARIAALEGNDA